MHSRLIGILDRSGTFLANPILFSQLIFRRAFRHSGVNQRRRHVRLSITIIENSI